MSGGAGVQFGPDGRVRLKGGKVLFGAAGDPCCCRRCVDEPCLFCAGCAAADRPNCGDGCCTPNQVTVVLAGKDALICGCAACGVADAIEHRITALAANGTYALPRVSPCRWELAGVGSFAYDVHFTTDCSDAPSYTVTGTFTVRVDRTITGWTVLIFGTTGGEILFWGSAAAPASNCKPAGLVVNDGVRSCCYGYSGATLASGGGTVSLTAC